VADEDGQQGESPHVSRDSYDLVVNRLLVPPINEATNRAHEGIAAPQDVSAA